MSRIHRHSPAVLAALVLASWGWAQPTQPVMPKTVETPLPPPVTLPAPPAWPDDLPRAPLTAAEAARIALAHQPSLVVARMGVDAAQGKLRQTQAGLAPTLGVSGGYTERAVTPADSRGGADGLSATFTLRRLLYDARQTRNQVRQSEAQYQATRANLTKAEADVVLQVKQGYYAYAQALRLIAVNEANLRNRQEHLAQAQARVKAGVGLPIDVVRAETAVAGAVQSLTQARNTAAVAGVALAQSMGLDPRTPLELAETEEAAVGEEDVNALVETALRQRPEVRQLAATVEAAGHALEVAKAVNSPALVGSVGYGVQGTGFPRNDTLTLGVSVQWNALDGGMRAGKIAEAQAQHATARAQLDAMTLAIVKEVAQAYLNAKTAEQRLVAAGAEVTNAQEALRLAQGRYTAGLGVFLDVLDAQATLVSAQTQRINAESARNQARAALAHALHADAVLPAPAEDE